MYSLNGTTVVSVIVKNGTTIVSSVNSLNWTTVDSHMYIDNEIMVSHLRMVSNPESRIMKQCV